MATAITYNEIQALYLGLLDRPANAAGENFWYGNGTASSSSVAKEIGTYAQYYSGDNGLNGAAITSSNIKGEIANIYTNLLGYTPSSSNSGVVYWSNVFNTDVTQGMTAGAAIGSITDQIFNIVENLTAGSPYINEKTTMDNRIATATAYTQANANVTYSPSAYLAEGQTIIATPTMTTINLTPAIDNIAPVGNTNIYGTLGTGATTANDTLNALDTIKATGSNNNLYISDQGGAGSNQVVPQVNISGVQTTYIQAVDGETVNTTSWTGLTALNLTASNGTDSITAAGTTAVTATDTLTSANAVDLITINGGSTVQLTTTNSTGATAGAKLGNIVIGTTTPTTGAVTVNATDTIAHSASAVSNITVSSGAAVTINSIVNTDIASSANVGAQTAGDAGLIQINAAVGNVLVNDATNNTSKAAVTIYADAVTVSSGATITVNETVSTTQAATAVSTIDEGAVTVNGDPTTTSVTVNQAAAATGADASAAVAAVAGVTAVTGETAQPGITAVTAVATVAAVSSAAAVTATPTVVDAKVAITDKNHATKTTASNTITTVSLNNYGAGSFFTGNALSNLTLAGTGAGFTITNAATGAGLTNTTLNLTLNALTDASGISDANNEIKTLNVTTEGGNSTLAAFGDTGLKTLAVSGSDVLTLTTVPSSITTLTVTGGAGFNGNISSTGVTAFAPTSTGVITTTINDTTQTFTGGAGQDIVTITANATKAVTGGVAANNEIILKGASGTFTASGTGTNVTKFTTLGINDTTAGDVNIYDMKNTFTGYNAIDVIAANAAGIGSTSFINVASGTTLAIDSNLAATTGALSLIEASIKDPAGNAVNVGTLLYQVNDATGASDTLNMSLGTAKTAGITVAGATGTLGLVLEDANAVGIGTLDVTSNGTGTIGQVNTVGVLTDDGLSHLNVSGADGLTITYLDEYTTQATAFALDNTSAGTVTITNFTDANLGSLTVSGTGQSAVGTLVDSGHVVSITDNSSDSFAVGTITDVSLNSLTLTGAVTVGTWSDATGASLTIDNAGLSTVTVGNASAGAFADASMTSLTLTGNVALGIDTVTGTTPNAATATGATTGVTVAAGTDNAHININLTGAASGSTDSITVGNGNDYITDGSTAGTVKVVVGTGSNLIVLGSTSDTTGSYAVTLGTHTPTNSLYDSISDGAKIVSSGTYMPTAPNLVITGATGSSATAGDVITFSADNQAVVGTTQLAGVSGVLTVQNAITASSSLATTISTLENAVSTHADNVAYSVFQGNTYIAEANNASAAAATNQSLITLIELVGTHTVAASNVADHLIVTA